MTKRLIALFLVVTMAFSIMPANVFAANEWTPDPDGQGTDVNSIRQWLEQYGSSDSGPETPEPGKTPSYLTPGGVEESDRTDGKEDEEPERFGAAPPPEDPVFPFDDGPADAEEPDPDTAQQIAPQDADPASVNPPEPVQAVSSGSCGDSLSWSFDDDTGVLTITGSGPMTVYDNADNEAPWLTSAAAITAVVLPEGLTTISPYAFMNCTALTEVTIPETVTSIGRSAFNGTGLSSVRIPASVETVERMAFRSCASFTAFTVAEESQSFQAVDGVLYSKDGATLVCWPCAKAGAVEIPAGVTAIADDAFSGCQNLTTVQVPASVVTVGEQAFMGSSVTAVQFADSSEAVSFGMSIFVSCASLTEVLLPAGLTAIPDYTFNGCAQLVSVNIPDSVQSVGYCGFYQCAALPAVELGAGVQSVGDYAFRDCSSLASVTLNEGLLSIGLQGFLRCAALAELSFPSTLQTIGNMAFLGCASLGSVVVPGTVQTIGDYVFYECTGLTSIVLEEGVQSFGKSLCYHCTSLQSAAIPGSVRSVGDYAFEGCAALTDVTLGEGLEAIGTGVFLDAASLRSVTIPASVTTIGNYAFAANNSGTMSLNKLTFNGPKPTTVGTGIFDQLNSSSVLICYYSEYASSWNPDGNTTARQNMPLMELSGGPGADPTEQSEYEELVRWDFETDPAADWSFVDSDGDTYNWEWKYAVSDVYAYEGSGLIASESYRYGVGVLYPDNWAVSPAFDLSDRQNASVSFYARLMSNSTAVENFAIYAGTSPDVSTMTRISGDYSATKNWTLYTASLESFSGQSTVYAAIRHYNVSDKWMLGVDNVQIHTGEIPEPTGPIGEPCGENLGYVLDRQNFVLTITGDGPMYDYDNDTNPAPWYNASHDNWKIRYIVFPEGITHIGSYAFFECSLQGRVELPASLTSIGPFAFASASDLGYFSVDPANTALKVVNNVVYTADGSTVLAGPCSGSITIAEGTVSIAPGALSGCYISGLDLPASVTEIGAGAFRNSRGDTVHIRGKLNSLGDNAFSGCSSLYQAVFHAGAPVSVGAAVFDGASSYFRVCYRRVFEDEWAPNGETSWHGYTLQEVYTDDDPICGDDLIWSFDENTGVLTIEGTGSMYSYSSSNPPPWADVMDDIVAVELPAGLTSFERDAFVGCENLSAFAVDPANEGYSSDGVALFQTAASYLYGADKRILVAYPAGRQGSYQVPDDVAAINVSAFSGATGLTEVIFNEGLTAIEASAFQGCTGLTSLTLPEGLTAINASVFQDCTGLTSLTLPEGLTTINASAFQGCTGLTGLFFPQSLTTIGSSAFRDCTGLSYVFFRENLAYINDSAFQGCTSMENVTLPKTLVTLGAGAFADCSDLHYAYFKGTAPSVAESGIFANCASDFRVRVRSSNLSTFGSNGVTWKGYPLEAVELEHCGSNLVWEFEPISGILTIEGTGAMYDYDDAENPAPWHEDAASIRFVEFSGTVTGIGAWAFRDCAVTEIVVPASVETVGAHAFDGCASLQKVTVKSTLETMGDGAFANAASLAEATFTAGPPASFGADVFAGCAESFRIRYPYQYAYAWGAPKITVWNGWPCRMYGDACGENLTYYIVDGVLEFVLTDETKPAFMTDFASASDVPWSSISYSQILLPEGLQNIGAYALQGQANITALQIPSSVVAIGDHALKDCTSLTELNLPANLETFDYTEWYTLTALTAVNVAEGGTCPCYSLGGMLMAQVDGQVTLVYCPAGLSGELTLPDGVQRISTDAVRKCNLLTSVVLPESLVSLEQYAFSNCDALQSVTFLGDKPTVLSNYYFYNGCSVLRTAYYTNDHAASWTADGNYQWNGLTLVNRDTMNDPVTGDCGENCHYTWYPLEKRLDIWADEGTVGVMDDTHPWSRYWQALSSVTVRGNVQNISDYAFNGYYYLCSVTLCEGVEHIGKRAFASCDSLYSIRLPASINRIDDYAFYGDLRGGAVFLGAPPATLGSNVFETRIFPGIYYMPNHVNDWAPNGETYWKGYKIFLLLEAQEGACGEGVTYSYDPDTRTLRFSGSGAMADFASPEEVPWLLVADYIEHIVVESGVTSVGVNALAGLTKLTDVSLGDTVAAIGARAFQNDSALTGLTLPASLAALDASAFLGCDALESFQVDEGSQSYSVLDGVLFSADGTVLVRWPNGKADMYYGIPEGVLTVGYAAFAGAPNLQFVAVPDGAAVIEPYAFFFCTGLSAVELPGGLTSLGDGAFAGCSNLEMVGIAGALPASVGESVFAGCDNLLILAAVEHDAGWYAPGVTEWQGCPIIGCHMEDHIIGRCGDAIVCAFDEDTGVLTVTGVGEMWNGNDHDIPWSSFEDDVTAVVLREGVTSIPEYAFGWMPNLNSVSLPATLESIGAAALAGNSALETLTLAGTDHFVLLDDVLFTADGEELLLCLPGKTGVYTIPDGTLFIAESAFEPCASLTEVVLPDGVEEIAGWAFYDCASLTKLNALGAPPQYVGQDIFIGCPDELTVWVGEAYESLWDEGEGTWHGRPLTVIAQELPIAEQAGEDLTWSFDAASGVLNVGGSGPMYDFVAFRPPWYELRDNIREVRIAEGVASIGAKAFYRYENLHTLRMPESLTAIGDQACYGCVSLGAILIPANVQHIGASAFASLEWAHTQGLLFLGGPPAEMGADAFANTTRYLSILPDNEELWYAAEEQLYSWEWLSSIKTVDGRLGLNIYLDYPSSSGGPKKYISNSRGKTDDDMYGVYVYGYGDMAEDLDGFTVEVASGLYFSEGITSIGSHAFCDYDDYDWYGVYELTLPETLQRIGDFAFSGMMALQYVHIPASVTEIGDGAFAVTPNLQQIEVDENNPVFMPGGLLITRDMTRILRIPASFSGEILDIPEGVTSLDSGALFYSAFPRVHIPASLTDLGETYAWLPGGWPLLLLPPAAAFDVDEDNPVFSSEGGLLYNKDRTELIRCPLTVTEATVPSTVNAIGPCAFQECSDLECLTFLGPKPESVEESAFWAACNDLFNPTAFYYINATVYYYAEYADSWAPNGETEWYGMPLMLAGDDSCGEDVHWRFSDGTLYLFGSGEMYSYFDADANTILPRPWDEFADEITAIIVGDGITGVGALAFAGLSAVEEVDLPYSLTHVDEYAFLACASLTELRLPNSILTVGEYAFAECHALQSVTLNEGLQELGSYAFANCGPITELHFPASLAVLGSCAFLGCSSLKTAIFDGPAPQAGEDVFLNCDTSLCIYADLAHSGTWAPNGETFWQGWPLLLLDWDALCGDSLSWAFDENTGVLTFYGKGAMYDYNDSDNPAPWRGYKDQITALVIPKGMTKIGSYAFADCTALTSVALPANTRTVNSYAFRGCTELVSFAFSPVTTIIYDWVFRDCAKLTNVTFPMGVTYVNEGAFYGCSSLASAELGDRLTQLDRWAFALCSSLQEVTLSAKLHTMKYYAFMSCTNLTRVVFKGAPPSTANDYIFSGNADLVLYYNPDYANSWAPNGETTWRVWPIAPDTEVDISTAPLSLTRLFYPNKWGLSTGEYVIYEYVGSETYAYLNSVNAYGQSESFTATFYRADDSAFTQNVEELCTITTDRLSEFASVEDAIFELGLKCALPSDVAGEYWVRADYTNAWQGKTHTAQTNVVHVYVEDKSPEEYFEFDAETNTITGYYGTEETVVFPAEIGGVPVKRLSLSRITNMSALQNARAFAFRNVVFQEGLEILDNFCFAKEKYLGDVTFPDSLYLVGACAFYMAPNVKTLTFGAGQKVGGWPYNLNESSEYTFRYGMYAFNGMTGLETVDMSRVSGKIVCTQYGYDSDGDGWVTDLGLSGYTAVGSFRGCPNITRLILPAMGGKALFDRYSFNVSDKLLDVENVWNYEYDTQSEPAYSYQLLTEPAMPVYTMLEMAIGHVEADANFVYIYDEVRNGYVIVSLRRDITDATGTAEFPATFNGEPIVRIGYKDSGASSYDGSIGSVLSTYCRKSFSPRHVVIQQGVKEIGYGAFSGMFMLQTLDLPQSLHSIGSKAFYTSFSTAGDDHYFHLTEVNLNHCSLSFVGDYAFYNAKLANFGDLDFIAGAHIGDYAFAVYHDVSETHYDNLTSITAHGSLNVGVGAFAGRWNLRTLTVDGSLMLGQDAFDGCYWLENVSYQGEIVDGDLADETRGFSHFRYTLAFPMVRESVRTYTYSTELGLDEDAYRVYCRSGDWCYIRYYYGPGFSSEWGSKSRLDLCLTLEDANIVVPARITDEVGEAEFPAVDLLAVLKYIQTRHPYTLYLTDGIRKLWNTLKLVDGNLVYDPVPKSLVNCTGVRFPETLEEVPIGLFRNGNLTGDVDIPASVTKIGDLAFAGCQIGKLTLHEGLQEIGTAAFSTGDADYNYKYHLADLYYAVDNSVPRSVTRVVVAGREEDENENQLPSTLQKVKDYAFAQTGISGKLTIPARVAALGDGAFYQTGITELRLSSSLSMLGSASFGSYGGVFETTSIGAFNQCPLTKIDLFDADITSLGFFSFSNGIHTFASGELSFAEASHPATEVLLPRGLKYVKFNSLGGVDPELLHFAAGLQEYYVEYPTETLNGKPVADCSITLPETVTTVHSSVFNLGTVTFYNQTLNTQVKQSCIGPVYNSEGYLTGLTFVEQALPNQIPDTCTVRCYAGSFIHNWCLANNLNFELIEEQPTPLKLQAYGDDGKVFTASDFSRIDWVDETTGSYLRFDTLTCPVHEFKADHVYSVRLWLNNANYETYDLDKGASVTFDPTAEDFEQTVYLKLYRRQAATVVGTFGDQRFLDGFKITAYSIKNDASTHYQDEIKTYPVTVNGDGSFRVEVPLAKVDLVASVSNELPYLPLTVKNVAYKSRNSLGQIDLGTLTLPAEQIIERIPVSHPISGVTRFNSGDGAKYADGSINIENGQYYINLTALREEFSIGETVVIRITESTSANGYAPYILTLPGEKQSPEPITLTPAQNAKVVLPYETFPIKLGAYDAFGHLTGYVSTNANFSNELYLPAGTYTLVAFQNSGANSLTLPDTLSEFLSASYGLAGYAQEEVTLTAGQEYEFSAEIPGYVVRSAVTVSFTEDARLADKEQGAYPVFLHYAVAENARSGDITFRLDTLDNAYTPFCEVGGAWAFFSGEGGTKFEVSKVDEFGDHHLQVVTDAYEGAICFYVRPAGQTLKLSVNGEYKTAYVIPGLSFSVSAPREQAIARNGSLTLSYTNGVPGAVAKVYADGEELSATALQVGAANKAKLDYVLPESEGEATFRLQVKVFNSAEQQLWESYEFPVIFSNKPVPVPERMDIRISNYNASDDGLPRVTNASYNFSTGEAEKQQFLILTEYYNPDGTFARDVEFGYYLHVQNPELVAYGEVYLKVWCCETEPKIFTVPLAWNETSGTFDGTLLFKGGERGVGDLPYGFDLEVPTERTQPEVRQDAIDAVNEWGELLTAEVDPELVEFYEARIDVDELRFVLEHGEMIEGLTEEEQQAFRDLTEEDIQAFIDLAEAKNGMADAYAYLTEELPVKLQGILFERQYEGMNDYFAAQGINAMQTVPPEGTTRAMLLSEGYAEIPTDYGVFYFKQNEATATLTCLDPPSTYIFATDSHALNASVRGPGDPVRSGSSDALDQFLNACYASYQTIDWINDWVYSNIARIVAMLDLYLDGDEALTACGEAFEESIEKLKNSFNAEKARLVLERERTIKWINSSYAERKVILQKGSDLILGTHTIDKELSKIDKILLDLRNGLAQAIKETSPSKLSIRLKAVSGVAKSPILKKALKVIPLIGGVVGIILGTIEMVDLSVQYEKTIKNMYNDNPLMKWEAIYCHKLLSNEWYMTNYYTDGTSSTGRVAEVEVGKEHDELNVSEAALNRNYLMYYLFAFAGESSFVDLSDYLIAYESYYYTKLKSIVEQYGIYYEMEMMMILAGLCTSALGLISNPFVSGGALAIDIGVWGARKLMNAFDCGENAMLEDIEGQLRDLRTECDDTLEPIVEKAFAPSLNWWNMLQIRQGIVANEATALLRARESFPSILLHMCSIEASTDQFISIEEYFDILESAYMDNKYMRALEQMENMLVSVDFNFPEEAMTPFYNAGVCPKMDPSGYVYEAVASNRVEGATASVYYRGADGSELPWLDAADYDEVNPQTTDSFGEYGWMTPIGKWRVRVEKEGYLPADSLNDPAADEDGWLPVPPPQLNVNIGLVSTAAPEVTSVAAAADRLQLTFSQYMSVADLEADPSLIAVTENGQNVPLAFTFADREESPTNEGVFYGRTLTVTRTDGQFFTGNGLSLHVDAAFQNYAGTPMTAAYDAQDIPVTQVVGSVEHDYPYGYVGTVGEYTELAVTVKDTLGNPVSGETVTLSAAYGDLYQVAASAAVTDENGVARFSVMAVHAGSEIFTFATPNGVSADVTASLEDHTPVEPEIPIVFSDVPENAWYHDAVYWAVEKKITDGTSNTTFSPNKVCAREDVVTFLWRAAGCPEPTITESHFTDVDPDKYYYDAVLWAEGQQITDGVTETTFGVGMSATRAEVLTLFWRAADRPEPTTEDNPFGDVSDTAWYRDAVLWALEKGITDGTSAAAFSPNRVCTRAHTVTFLYRASQVPVYALFPEP